MAHDTKPPAQKWSCPFLLVVGSWEEHGREQTQKSGEVKWLYRVFSGGPEECLSTISKELFHYLNFEHQDEVCSL